MGCTNLFRELFSNLQVQLHGCTASSLGKENQGIANMGPNDVFLWTGDVVTTTNTHKNCNVAISLFIQQHDKYQSGFQSNSVFTAAKAMARPIRPMWDEDFSDGLR